MSLVDLPLVLGRAVDDETTNNRHQISSVKFNRKTGLHTLEYSVFHSHQEKTPDFSVPEDFVDVMCGKTPTTYEGKQKIDRLHSSLLRNIRPLGKEQAFEEKIKANAHTYDIYFTPELEFISFDDRATIALMYQKLTCQNAYDKAFAEPPDNGLRIWHDFALNQHNMMRPEKYWKKSLKFQEVTSITTELIQREMRRKAFKEGRDCIYRIGADEYALPENARKNENISVARLVKLSTPTYGSVLKKISRTNEGTNGPEEAVIQGTAIRNDIDSFNVTVNTEFKKNHGQNIFQEGVATGFASYKRHVATWQCLGMM